MLKQVIEVMELLDSSKISGEDVKKVMGKRGIPDVTIKAITREKGSTDFIKIKIPGTSGKATSGDAPTLGVIGRLGGVGARPEKIGLVSDSDGATVALSLALKLGDMKEKGDTLPGDLIISTHICPDAPIKPHVPVPFMGSPVDMETMNRYEIEVMP